MAKEFKLEIEKRELVKKSALKSLRKDFIPGIYYSSDSKQSIPFQITKKMISEAIKSGAYIFNISVEGKKKNVLFKSVQYHPVTDDILHIDLFGIKMDEKVVVKVPLNIIGDAVGVKEEGGILNQALNELEISCLPLSIPDVIDVDISTLHINENIQAGNVALDDELDLVTSETEVIVSVTQMMKEVAAATTDDDLEDGQETELEESETKSDGDESKDNDKNSDDSSEG